MHNMKIQNKVLSISSPQKNGILVSKRPNFYFYYFDPIFCLELQMHTFQVREQPDFDGTDVVYGGPEAKLKRYGF